MIELTDIDNYSDAAGNVIISPSLHRGSKVTFKGSNNTLIIGKNAMIDCVISFDCDNARIEIGSHPDVEYSFKAIIRMGQDARLIIGENVTCTSTIYVSSMEGALIQIGDDTMFGTSIAVRSDDSHPIFDVMTEKRINFARDVTIGEHVWLCDRSAILSGATIGNGSVIGLGSIVKGVIPNNCIAAGNPARVIKKDIAWERPHLSLNPPFYKHDSSTVQKSGYWNLTQVDND